MLKRVKHCKIVDFAKTHLAAAITATGFVPIRFIRLGLFAPTLAGTTRRSSTPASNRCRRSTATAATATTSRTRTTSTHFGK